MDEFSFEFVEAFYVGPFPVADLLVLFLYIKEGILQNPACVDENIAFILECPGSYPNSDSPFSFVFVPPSFLYGMLVLDIFVDFILCNRLLQVLVYLLRSRIVIRPPRIRLERVRIVVSWDIALAARVSAFPSVSTGVGEVSVGVPILQPRPPNVIVALVDDEFCVPVLHALVPDYAHENARVSCAETDYSHRAAGVDRFFADFICIFIQGDVVLHCCSIEGCNSGCHFTAGVLDIVPDMLLVTYLSCLCRIMDASPHGGQSPSTGQRMTVTLDADIQYPRIGCASRFHKSDMAGISNYSRTPHITAEKKSDIDVHLYFIQYTACCRYQRISRL